MKSHILKPFIYHERMCVRWVHIFVIFNCIFDVKMLSQLVETPENCLFYYRKEKRERKKNCIWNPREVATENNHFHPTLFGMKTKRSRNLCDFNTVYCFECLLVFNVHAYIQWGFFPFWIAHIQRFMIQKPTIHTCSSSERKILMRFQNLFEKIVCSEFYPGSIEIPVTPLEFLNLIKCIECIR